MDTTLTLSLVVAFVAVVAALEGAWMLWHDRAGPQAQRLQRRMRLAASAEQAAHSSEHAPWLRPDGRGAHPWTARLRHLARLDIAQRWIEQAGLETTGARLLGMSAAAAAVAGVAAAAVHLPWRIAVALALLASAGPWLWLAWRRRSRLARLQEQLPGAVDLMARALRAGHALPATLQMVGEESPEPLAAEFRLAHEELNFGLSMDEALRHLAARVPCEDMGFLVIAVLLQRETGGNLAEVLSNIASLVRSRQRLLARVQVLAAEGKLSAWILGLMPIVVGGLLNLINPNFVSQLWRDPVGLQLIQACVVLYALGAVWMWKLIRIRV
ncbi:MAG: type II secretion system F family protein [Rubrivivax sp.]